MRVLVVAPHPDDECFGMAGTIARLAREDHDIAVACMTNGVTSRPDPSEPWPVEAIKARERACEAALALLGARFLGVAGFKDNAMDRYDLLDIAKYLEGVMKQERPEALYTTHGSDLNVDHSLTYRAVLIATRPKPGATVRAVYAYEVPSATDWSFAYGFRPNVFIDVSGTMEAKMKALRCYGDECPPFPHPRSLEAVESNARRWGSVAGVEAAEAFELVRWVR